MKSIQLYVTRRPLENLDLYDDQLGLRLKWRIVTLNNLANPTKASGKEREQTDHCRAITYTFVLYCVTYTSSFSSVILTTSSPRKMILHY